MVPEWCTTKATAPQETSKWRQAPPSHGGRLLLPAVTGQAKKNVLRKPYKMMAPVKWWHHNISSAIPGAIHVVCHLSHLSRSCPSRAIHSGNVFPVSAYCHHEELSTEVTPPLQPPLPNPSIPIEMAPQQKLAATGKDFPP